MQKYNSTGILTGYIKQLLASFNLPKLRIYTAAHEQYFEQHKRERWDIIKTYPFIANNDSTLPYAYYGDIHYVPYIRHGEIQQYIGSYTNPVSGVEHAKADIISYKWQTPGYFVGNPVVSQLYHKGMYIPNYTKTLQIRNNVYDSYTHEYLGDYLRFKRDFEGINLMPLYNCFSNRVCENLQLAISSLEGRGYEAIFDSFDTNYKIYMIPVKLFQKYTIAIDSAYPVELCCAIYGSKLDDRKKFKDLPRQTYKRFTNLSFTRPLLYEALATESTFNPQSKMPLAEQVVTTKREQYLTHLAQNESDLKLFIKLSADNKSSITILEGDFCKWNDSMLKFDQPTAQSGGSTETAASDNFDPIVLKPRLSNHLELNLNNDALKAFEDSCADIPLITPLQLLRFNTMQSRPFADRLIEYLLGNCIDASEELPGNIARLQKVLHNSAYRTACNPRVPGTWDDRYRLLLYAAATGEYTTFGQGTRHFNRGHDALGYVDKDVERWLTDSQGNSLLNTELDEEGN